MKRENIKEITETLLQAIKINKEPSNVIKIMDDLGYVLVTQVQDELVFEKEEINDVFTK